MRLARFSICGLDVVAPAASYEAKLFERVARLAPTNLEGAIREMDRGWRSVKADHRALAPVYARLLVRQGRSWGTVIGLLSHGLEGLETPDTQADLALAFERSGQAALAAQTREASRTLATRLDGRATFSGTSVRGWVRLGSQPKRALMLQVRDELGSRASVRADQMLPGGRQGFSFEPRKLGLNGELFEIAAKLPDGSVAPLPDAPLVSARYARARMAQLTPRQRTKPTASPPPVSVVIPVYRDRDRTLACVDSVLQTTKDHAASIIVVDDASPEPELSAALDALAARDAITLLRNPKNLGFSASVNRAVAHADGNDVVLVNSDVVVFGDWLTRMRRAAYARPRVGTVTPLTDDDSIAGYAGGKVGEDPIARAERLDRIAASDLDRRTTELPVGVGFCMYIRRDCWADTGIFDDAVFAAGYGEEADFCMRARARKWEHVLAADVFVHHAQGQSFGTRRPALLERSARLLNLRHPGYDDFVRVFTKRDPIAPARRALDEASLRASGSRFVLMLTLALPGGVDRFVADRSRELRAQGNVPLLLRPRKLDDMSECVLECPELGLVDLRYRIPADLPALRALLESLQIDSTELQHFLGLDPRVVAMVRALGRPVDTYVHDYALICPRVTLVDGTGSYCGEPAVSVCEQCVKRNGSNLPETISVRALRRRSGEWLRASRRVVAPTQDTAQRLQRYFPDQPIDVVAHETFLPASAPPPPRAAAKAVRVATIGAIGHHKGYKVLLDCARDAARRGLDLEFVVVGYSEDDERLIRTGRVFVTGRYRDSEIAHLLRREAPDVVFLPSIWPETWCYTLSHSLASGLPVAAFDIGAIAERLRAEQKGTLFRPGMSPREINDRLIDLARDGHTHE
ncbi:MAG TPA: glycosyltransferase [Nevskiaceae bacterium]|nr:glycosyltransferase [Nevskiaceae bacterium]